MFGTNMFGLDICSAHNASSARVDICSAHTSCAEHSLGPNICLPNFFKIRKSVPNMQCRSSIEPKLGSPGGPKIPERDYTEFEAVLWASLQLKLTSKT